MVDYAIRFRCQGSCLNGSHCKRRGWTHFRVTGWLCWQHYRVVALWSDDNSYPLMFSPEPLP
jgi:hypothetical protein